MASLVGGEQGQAIAGREEVESFRIILFMGQGSYSPAPLLALSCLKAPQTLVTLLSKGPPFSN